MNMKKYHSHTLLYLHETIELGSGHDQAAVGGPRTVRSRASVLDGSLLIASTENSQVLRYDGN